MKKKIRGMDYWFRDEEEKEPANMQELDMEEMHKANKASAIRQKYNSKPSIDNVVSEDHKKMVDELMKLNLPMEEHNRRLKKILPGVPGETDKTQGYKPKRKKRKY